MRRILTLLLAVLMCSGCFLPARADTLTDLVLLLEDEDVPIPGGKFELYRVGEQTADGKQKLTGAFADYPVEINGIGEDTGPEAAVLYAFARKDGISPDVTVETDHTGMATASKLPSGLYLVAGQPVRYKEYRYHSEPHMILLPQKNPVTGQVLYMPVLQVKVSREPYTPESVSRKVLKIWDDHSGRIRPDSVTVHLLKDGTVFSTVSLTAQNQWRYTWDNLDADAQWQITEDVPDGYTVTVEQEGNTFLLTNSAPEVPPPETTPPTSSGGKIPQTGVLWWQMAALAVLGLLLILVGGMFHKKWLMIFPGVLVLTAAGLMAVSAMRQQAEAEKTSLQVLTRLEMPAVHPEQEMAEQPSVPDFQRNPHMELPSRNIDGTDYVGTLEVPALSLELPVAGTTTGENLQKAPCRYSGSPYTEDLTLGAHNYDAHFGRLRQLSYGEEIRFTDLEGNAFSYRVADIEILQPDQLKDLLSGGWPLTLYTCTPGGQSRVVVRCEKD